MPTRPARCRAAASSVTARPVYVARDFTLAEFAVSASHPELVSPVPTALIPRVQLLASKGLQVLRDAIGQPLTVLSGFRSDRLNRAVGGSPTSQHVVAEAADVTCDDIRGAWRAVLGLVRDGRLPGMGQIIGYPQQAFIHMALASARYPRATCHIHDPSRGLQYQVVAANPALLPVQWPA